MSEFTLFWEESKMPKGQVQQTAKAGPFRLVVTTAKGQPSLFICYEGIENVGEWDVIDEYDFPTETVCKHEGEKALAHWARLMTSTLADPAKSAPEAEGGC